MKVSDLGESRFLRKEDVGDGMLVTFWYVEQVDVSMENEPPRLKWVAHFQEHDAYGQPIKPLVLGPTTGGQIADALGSDDSDDWLGKQVVLFNDMSVRFQNVRGGIRVRPYIPQGQHPAPPPPPQRGPAPHQPPPPPRSVEEGMDQAIYDRRNAGMARPANQPPPITPHQPQTYRPADDLNDDIPGFD